MNKKNQKQVLGFKQSLLIWMGLLSFGILSWALFMWPGQKKEERYEVKRAIERAERLKELREQEAKVLEGYAWQDTNTGLVRIPIKDAMKLALEQLQKKPVRQGSVIAAAVSGGITNGATLQSGMLVTNRSPGTNLLQENQGMGVTRTNNTNSIRSDTNTIRSDANTIRSDTNSIRSDTNTVRTNEVRRLSTNPNTNEGFIGTGTLKNNATNLNNRGNGSENRRGTGSRDVKTQRAPAPPRKN